MNFQPIGVPADSWKGWIMDSVDLVTRGMIINTIIMVTALWLLSYFSSKVVTFSLPLLTPLLLGCFTLIAYSKDHSLSVIEVVSKNIFYLGLYAVICFGVARLLSTVLFFSLDPVLEIVETLHPHKPTKEFTQAVVLFLLMPIGAIFLLLTIPLIGIYKVPMLMAHSQSCRAITINPFIMHYAWFPFFFIFLLSLSPPLSGVAAIILYPFIGTLMYVITRHVFTGQKENKKQQVEKIKLAGPVSVGGNA